VNCPAFSRTHEGDRRSIPRQIYADLITAVHRALNAPFIVIWDNLNTHRSRAMRAFTTAHLAG
jgi:putative transposase